MANKKRLIDANVMREDWLENGQNEFVYDTNSVLDSIDAQPTVDAVEVVRCKDCKQWNVHGTYGKKILGECGLLGKIMNYEDFCSRGERRTDG